jgi:hypothetical protein
MDLQVEKFGGKKKKKKNHGINNQNKNIDVFKLNYQFT